MKPKSDLSLLMYLKRIDQIRIAQELGVHQTTVSRWLKNPTNEQKKRIMEAIERIEGEQSE